MKGPCVALMLILSGIKFVYKNEEVEREKRKPILGTGRNIMRALNFQSMELYFRSKSRSQKSIYNINTAADADDLCTFQIPGTMPSVLRAFHIYIPTCKEYSF